MTPSIEPSLFDFVDELAYLVREGRLEPNEPVEADSTVITFCESFFDQFFAYQGHSIRQFGRKAKEQAAGLAEHQRRDSEESTKESRRIIVMFEEFCDVYDDLSGNYSGGSVTYETFHVNYLSRLLDLAADWARVQGLGPLVDRIVHSYENYMGAIEDSAWMTMTPKKKESALRRLISRKRTTS